jgi:NAD(P)-dependent dehydrogenase (short-subunit alcohol dehydrogenase family)
LLHGIKQVIVVARSEDKFNTAREDWSHRDGIICGERNVRVQFVPCDLGDITDVRAAAEKIKKKTNRVHILLCNAGRFATTGSWAISMTSIQSKDLEFHTNTNFHHRVSTESLPPIASVTRYSLLCCSPC